MKRTLDALHAARIEPWLIAIYLPKRTPNYPPNEFKLLNRYTFDISFLHAVWAEQKKHSKCSFFKLYFLSCVLPRFALQFGLGSSSFQVMVPKEAFVFLKLWFPQQTATVRVILEGQVQVQRFIRAYY